MARQHLFEHTFQRYSRWFVLAGVLFAIFFGIAEIKQWPLQQEADHVLLDEALKGSANHHLASHVVVIDLDEKSLAALGQWPWPRYQVASLIQHIAKAKPSAIGLDLMFPEADRTSLINIQNAFKRDFGLDIAFSGAPDGLSDNDGFLGFTIANTKAVASNYFFFDHWTRTEASEASRPQFIGGGDGLALRDASGMLGNTEKIAAQTDMTGFINTQPDMDGDLRRITLLLSHNHVIHGNLALATYMQSQHLDQARLSADRNGPVIEVGDRSIPIDQSGDAILRFEGGPQLYTSLSAVDVLNGDFKPELLAGKMVFVGSSAAALSDLHHTAFDPYFPGLDLQAAMAENIASGRFVRVPSWDGYVIVIECLLLAVLMAMLFTKIGGALAAVIGSGLIALLPVLISITAFSSASVFISPAAPLLLTALLFLVFSAARFVIEQRQAFLSMRRLQNARQVTIESMAAVAETRDPETGAHIKRTQHYVKAVAEQLRKAGHYKEILTREYIETLFISAPLHDIGKVGVPDHILLKAGKLTPEELVIMRRHADFGRSIIASTSRMIEGDNYLTIAGEIAATHHEKWDGSGYPLGLSGQAIPLSGRIMAVADIYDALISKRCYKEPFPHSAATKMMAEMRGQTFDPVILDAFFSIEDTIVEIARTYSDDFISDPATIAKPGDLFSATNLGNPEQFIGQVTL
jgi:HD-GYP domain-containing protein (c-di-GMP phosphodiesterase class II)